MRHPRSLRVQLTAIVAVVALLGLLVADVATYTALRRYLADRTDRTLDAAALVIERSLERRGPPGRRGGDIRQLGAFTPGLYVQLRDADGGLVFGDALAPPGEVAAIPTLPGELEVVGDDIRRLDADGFRVRASALPGGLGTLVLAVPVEENEEVLRRLVAIEAVVTVAVVSAGALVGFALVRRRLAPLERIADDAAAIGAGDLARRVDVAGGASEVAQLGGALNAMLGQIEAAFAERTASEERLRRFVADASHELRTPVAAVRAYAELFDRGARDRPDDLARTMAGIGREAERMGLLVEDLLLLARLDQGRPLARDDVDLAVLAEEAVDAARAIDPERPLALEAEPVTVVGDAACLRQVLDNLLLNVRTHTPAGTTATVRVAVADGRAVVAVEDAGPGLAEHDRARVFERFYRADPSRTRAAGGSGLGLAIVRAIVEAHGGTVAALAGRGGPGTCIRVELPVVAVSPAAAG